jgi:hypothetical protein
MTISNDKKILFKVYKHVTEFKVVIFTVFKEEFLNHSSSIFLK